ncbi:MAG: hypothetical protein LBE02_02195 [Spirochaetaceae bacterium]|nr:hypothetical protein [Spirochaetaceae bacterium]
MTAVYRKRAPAESAGQASGPEEADRLDVRPGPILIRSYLDTAEKFL